MDDLSSLDWNSSKPPSGHQSTGPRGNYYPTLRPTPPISGRSTPLSQLSTIAQKPLSNVPSGSKSSTPANDSFANLVSFKAGLPPKSLSLQEQQRILQEQKQQQEEEKRKQFDGHFALQPMNPGLWDNFGSGRSTPNQSTPAPPLTSTDEDDVLAAFNSSAPVDSSSHMPPPSRTDSHEELPIAPHQTLSSSNGNLDGFEDQDDDPFGLGMNTARKSATNQSSSVSVEKPGGDSDDVLGLLGRPVSDFSKPQPQPEDPAKSAFSAISENPQARAVAELVNMGFSPEKSQSALEATESGVDVQAAVGWLLNQAHDQSKLSSKSSQPQADGNSTGHVSRRKPGRRTSSSSGGPKPAWMKDQATASAAHRLQEKVSAIQGEEDSGQGTGDIGNSIFKTANSLWKTSTKKLNQAVSDFNSETDPSQPKWMKEARSESASKKPKPSPRENKSHSVQPSGIRQENGSLPNMTDEAMLLEGGGRPPQRTVSPATSLTASARHPRLPALAAPTSSSSASLPLEAPERLTQSKFMQQARHRDPRVRLTRQAVEEEAAQVYISSARRKRPAPNVPPVDLEPDLLFDGSTATLSEPKMPTRAPGQPSRPASSAPLPVRPPPPKRNVPPISPSAIQTSVSSRQAGSAAFKRGDYAEATAHYSSALRVLPSQHPLMIPLLTNRALSHLKTGDPKAAIMDATTTIELTGASRGAGETIDLNGDEGIKPMEPYWGKAMIRKAEALEQLERWADAAETWRACVSAGVGGATSISGRNRCEGALKPKPAPSAATKKVPPRPKPSALSDLNPTSKQSSEAVSRLRAANAAADRLDDEKFKLADIVANRVSQWRANKEANLRALLASLENVLWQDAGWKKVSMAELIQPNKVKIVYMKGIARVHPDKVGPLLVSFED